MSTAEVDRPRILLDIEPRILRDALEEVLDSVGLDEVLVSDAEAADRSTMSFDAAIVTLPADGVRADVVIELRDGPGGSLGRVNTGTTSEDVPLGTPEELLTLLDQLLPAATARISPIGGSQR